MSHLTYGKQVWFIMFSSFSWYTLIHLSTCTHDSKAYTKHLKKSLQIYYIDLLKDWFFSYMYNLSNSQTFKVPIRWLNLYNKSNAFLLLLRRLSHNLYEIYIFFVQFCTIKVSTEWYRGSKDCICLLKFFF